MADTLAGQSTVGQEESSRYTTPPGNAPAALRDEHSGALNLRALVAVALRAASRGLDPPCLREFACCQDARCATGMERTPVPTPDVRAARHGPLAGATSLVITHPDRINDHLRGLVRPL
jgi:hypothetical protein